MALAEETSAGVTYVITEVASDCLFCVTILHTVVITQPSQSAFSEQRVHTGSTIHGISVGHFFLSRSAQDTTDASQVVRGAVEYSILSGIYRCHTAAYWHCRLSSLSSSTARSLPTLESSDEHERSRSM